jgi:hypothetical protein
MPNKLLNQAAIIPAHAKKKKKILELKLNALENI